MSFGLGFWAAAGAGGSSGGAGAYELISTATGTGSNTFFQFLSIPQTYKHLQFRITYNANTGTNGNYGLVVAPNGDDTTTDNALHSLYANANTGAVASNSKSNATLGNTLIDFPGNEWGSAYLFTPNSYSTQFISGIIDILDYTNTSKNKTLKAFHGFQNSGGYRSIGLSSSLWTNTAAITSFTIYLNNGPAFATGSRLSLYGIKG